MKTRLYIFLCIAVLFGILNLFNSVQSLELKALDVFRGRSTPHPDIVILAIDNKSLQSIGRFPWDRKIYAQILQKLQPMGPRAVAFDINFSEAQNFENDQAFKQALDNSNFPIVLASEAIYTKNSSQPQKFTKPVSYFYEKANVSLGLVNVAESPDALIRKMPESLSIGRETLKPLAYVLAEKLKFDLPTKNNLFVNYAGPAGSFPTFSVSDLLDGKINPQELENKVVLLGATASDLRDYLTAPVKGSVLAGIEYHANVLDNLFLRRYIKVLPNSVSMLVGLIAALILLLASFKLKTRQLTILFVVLFIGIAAASFVLWQFKYALPYFLSALFVLALYLGLSFHEWYIAEMEKRKLRRTMQLYFSPSVLKLLTEHPERLKLGGERKEVTILFSDIRSFTTITETTDPEILTKLLHEYFTEMTQEILDTDGVLDKFIGDAVMAFWGAPFEQIDQADRAVKAAIGMMKRLKALQAKWEKQNYPYVNIGIGIHTGMVTVGNMGSEKRFDYTVIGDSVNGASRLEGLNKEHKTNIIISDVTKGKLTIPVQTKELGDVFVKGKNTAIKIYEVIA